MIYIVIAPVSYLFFNQFFITFDPQSTSVVTTVLGSKYGLYSLRDLRSKAKVSVEEHFFLIGGGRERWAIPTVAQRLFFLHTGEVILCTQEFLLAVLGEP